jgi:hypothetical protein
MNEWRATSLEGHDFDANVTGTRVRVCEVRRAMRHLRSLSFVLSSSIFGFVACSSSSSPVGFDADAGAAIDAGVVVDTGAPDSGNTVVDAGFDSGPIVTGDFSCAGATLPTSAPASITIAGKAFDQSLGGQTALEGAALSAYPTQTSTTASSNAITDATGAFSLVVGTGATPVDGYIKATTVGEMDTYLYANAPLAKDQSGLNVIMLTANTYALLTGGAGVTQDAAKAVVAVLVLDCEAEPVQGAVVSTSPAGTVRYNDGSLPSTKATATAADGIAYVFNVPAGDVTVSVMAGATALRSHHVVSRSGAFTTTLVTP